MPLTTRPLPPDPSFSSLTETTETPRATRTWWVIAAIAGAVSLGVQIYLMWGSTTPTFPFDEVNLLQISRIVAGADAPLATGYGYFPAWSVVLAPLWWFIDDPQTFYTAGLIVGIVVSMLTALPLAALARRVGLPTPQALTVAFLVLTMPSRTVQSDFLLSERLLMLVLALTAVAVWRAWERPTMWRTSLVALLAALTYFSHLRALVFVAATAVWLVLLIRRAWRSALVGLVVLAVATFAARVAGDALNAALLGHATTQGDSFMKALRESTPVLVAKVGTAQTWEQLVASFGLAAVGLLVVVVVAWRGVRRLEAQPMVWVLGTLAAITMVSVASWSAPGPLTSAGWMRLDVWIYGRYLDPVVALVVTFGLAVMLRALRRVPALIALAFHAFVALVTVVWIAPDATTWGYVTPAHIPGVMPWYSLLPRDGSVDTAMLPTLTNANSFWAWASLTSLAVHAVLVLLRRKVELIAGLLIVVLGVASVLSDPATDNIHDAEDGPAETLDVLHDAMDATGATSVAYDAACREGRTSMSPGLNYFGWWMLPSVLDVTDEDADLSQYDVVIGCPEWDEADELGALNMSGTTLLGSTVWVMPGELQEVLAADGRLE